MAADLQIGSFSPLAGRITRSALAERLPLTSVGSANSLHSVRRSTRAALLEKSVKNAPNNTHSSEPAPDFVGPVLYRTCTCCGRTKCMFEFSRHSASKYRRNPVCKVCNAAKSREYYSANTDSCSLRASEYRASNSQTLKEKKAAYFQANKAQIVAKRRAEREADPDRYHAYWAAYYAKHKDDPEYIRKKAERNNSVSAKVRKLRKNRETRYTNPEGVHKYQAEYRASNKEKISNLNRTYYERRSAEDPEYRAYRSRHVGSGGFVSTSDLMGLRRQARLLTQMTGEKHVVDHIYPLRSERVSGLNTAANLQVVTQTYNLTKQNKLLKSLSHEHYATEPWEVFDDIN